MKKKSLLPKLTLGFLLTAGAFGVKAATVTGSVSDAANGEPLTGVSVMVRGAATGTATDIDGRYSIDCPDNATLQFSYIGYKSVSEKVAGRSTVDVKMEEDAARLDEVVVIGYGTMDKKELTSAITHVSDKDFLSVASADPAMMIQGKVPGLSVTNVAAADPNQSASIQLRGISSRSNGLSPLIVIDGVAGGSLSSLNPEDIASFDILKDGAASAIYGTRGSNGVILITTKKGTKDGGVHTTFTSQLAWDHALKELDMMSAKDYREVRLAGGDKGTDLGGDYDWMDGVTRTGFAQKYTLSVAGGNSRTNYRVSVDYRNAHGVDLRSSREEYGARASFFHSTKGGLLDFTVNVAPRVIYADLADWGFQTAAIANPTTPLLDPQNPEQYYNFMGQAANYNPVEAARLETNRDQTKIIDWNATARLNLLPLFARNSDLPLTLNTSVTFADHQASTDNKWHRPSTSTQAINAGRAGQASRSYSSGRQYSVEWLVNFGARFGRHNLKAMAGYSYEYGQYSGFNVWNNDFPNDGLGADNIGAGSFAEDEGEVDMNSYKNDNKLVSFFGRVTYDWAGRYMLTASLRHEGSSRFGKDHKWGNFPAVSGGWRISQEPFMEASRSWLDELKIRADYGVTGNQEFGNYKSLDTMSPAGYYMYQGQYYRTWGPRKNVNPDLHWEKGHNFNVGVDFAMFSSRFWGSLNYFNRRQSDLVGDYEVPVPPYIESTVFVNVGTMKNQGLELDLNFNAVNTRDWAYTIGLVGAWVSNKFVSFSNSKYVGHSYEDMAKTKNPYPNFYLQRIQEGQSVGNFYMYKYAGFTPDGQWLVYDHDGDIIKAGQANDQDRRVVGNGLPKFTMSMTHNVRYRNFDLTLFFRGAFDYDIFNIHDFYYGTRNFNGNTLRKAYGKNYGISPDANPAVCDYFLERGDYFKLDQLTLGYTLRNPKMRFIDSVRIYGTVKNVFTITKFSGVDPSCYDVNGRTPGAMANGSYYPSTRQFILGLQVDF